MRELDLHDDIQPGDYIVASAVYYRVAEVSPIGLLCRSPKGMRLIRSWQAVYRLEEGESYATIPDVYSEAVRAHALPYLSDCRNIDDVVRCINAIDSLDTRAEIAAVFGNLEQLEARGARLLYTQAEDLREMMNRSKGG